VDNPPIEMLYCIVFITGTLFGIALVIFLKPTKREEYFDANFMTSIEIVKRNHALFNENIMLKKKLSMKDNSCHF